MNPRRKQRIYASIAAIAFLLLIVWLGSSLLVYFSSGAKWETEVQTANLLDRYRAPVHWQQELDPADTYMLEIIGDQYARAMHALFLSKVDRDATLLTDYFSNIDSNWSQFSASFEHAFLPLDHTLELKLLSDDKSVAIFLDKRSTVYEHVKQGDVLDHTIVEYSYEVMMTLDDGKWRIRHLTATDVKESTVPSSNLNLSIDRIDGINYYPQETPWLSFWENYDSRTTAEDLQLIQSLGLNSVRIFIPFFEHVTAARTDSFMSNLKDFVEQASNRGIAVLPVLFDFPSSYDIRSCAQAEQYIKTVVVPLADHPSILGWDLKNEPDLDFERHGKTEVLNWLSFVLRRVKYYDRNSPVTIGWSNLESASNLESQVDFVSFHYYRPLNKLAESELPTSKPVVCTEYGVPTHNSWWFPGGRSENEQAIHYRECRDFFASNGHGSMSWTLYDFPEVPGYVSGAAPWILEAQKNYGIVREDATLKPAAARESAGELHITLFDSIRRFHITLTILIIGFVVIMAFGAPRIIRKFYER